MIVPSATGLGDTSVLDGTGSLRLTGDGFQVVGPPSLALNQQSGIALTPADAAAYNAAFGAPLATEPTGAAANVLNCGTSNCGQLNAAPANYNQPSAVPFCGNGSKQWISGLDNCTLLIGGGVALFGVLLLAGAKGRGR